MKAVDALHAYVVPWLQADWPLDWEVTFGRAAPLVLEIGFGDGQFFIEQAARQPDANIVGIELSWGRVHRLARRLDHAGLMYGRLLHCEAQMALQYLFEPNTLHAIFINFPDPWPKQRHRDRRLIQTELVELLHDRLVAGGQVTIATDHPDYATWIAGILGRQGALRSCFSTTMVSDLPGHTPTKYEQKARGANLPIFYFVWHKPSSLAPRPSTRRRKAMPHMVLQGTHDLEQTLGTYLPRTWREMSHGVEVSTSLIRAYRELTGNSWLLELVVKEGKLCQQIGVAVVLRSQAQMLLKLSAIGFPRPTWGVQRAIWHVAQMLQEHNPQLQPIWMSMGLRDFEVIHQEPTRRGARRQPSMPAESGSRPADS